MIEPEISEPRGFLQHIDWTIADTAVLFLFGFIGGIAGAIVGLVIYQDEGAVGLVLLSAGFQSLASILWLVHLSRSKGTGSIVKDVGLVFRAKDVWALPLGFVLQIAVVLLILNPIAQLVGPDAPEQGVVESARDVTGLARLGFVVLVGIVAPFVEEVIFRGVLLSRLTRSMSNGAAITVSAGAFAIIHLIDPNAWVAVPGLFVIAWVLGWLALRDESLSRPILAHIGVNMTAILALFYAGDLESAIGWIVG